MQQFLAECNNGLAYPTGCVHVCLCVTCCIVPKWIKPGFCHEGYCGGHLFCIRCELRPANGKGDLSPEAGCWTWKILDRLPLLFTVLNLGLLLDTVGHPSGC